jgi:CrcB protein
VGDIDEPDILPMDPDVDGPSIRPGVIAVIAAGGALGVAARYGIGRAIPTTAGAFPWATFAINVSGSFVLGLFMVIVFERLAPTRYLRPFFGTGFIGAFTTFSTFSVETDLLIKDDHLGAAVAYVLSTLVFGLFCAWLGINLGRLLPGGPRVDHA